MNSDGSYDDLRSVVDLIDSMIDHRNQSSQAPFLASPPQRHDPHCPTCGTKWPWSWERTSSPNPTCDTCNASCTPTAATDANSPWRDVELTAALVVDARPRKSELSHVWRVAAAMQEVIALVPELARLDRPTCQTDSALCADLVAGDAASQAVTGRIRFAHLVWWLAPALLVGSTLAGSVVIAGVATAIAATLLAIAYASGRRNDASLEVPKADASAEKRQTAPPGCPPAELLEAVVGWNTAADDLSREKQALTEDLERLPSVLGEMWESAYLHRREQPKENEKTKLSALLSMYRIADAGVGRAVVAKLAQCGFLTAADVTIESLRTVSPWLPEPTRLGIRRWRDRAAQRELRHVKDEWWRCEARQLIASHIASLTERTRSLVRSQRDLVVARDSIGSMLSQSPLVGR